MLLPCRLQATLSLLLPCHYFLVTAYLGFPCYCYMLLLLLHVHNLLDDAVYYCYMYIVCYDGGLSPEFLLTFQLA